MSVTQYFHANFALSSIAGGASGLGTSLNPSDTTLYIQSTDVTKFPTQYPYQLTIGARTAAPEIVQVTAGSGAMLTILRAQEGTIATGWSANTAIQHTVTAGDLNALWATAIVGGTYFVDAYGTTGTANDTSVVQAALNAANAAGGGLVVFSAKTYTVVASSHPNNPSMTHCLHVGPNTRLQGAGIGATIIKLAASQPDNTHILTNTVVLTSLGTFNSVSPTYPPTTGYDTNISIADLTIDGNNTNQGTSTTAYGIDMQCVVGVRLTRVRVQSILGTQSMPAIPGSGVIDPAYPAGAGVGINCYSCQNVWIDTCEVSGQPGGNTGTGFRDACCTNVRYDGCTAHHHTFGGGFHSVAGTEVQYHGCHAYLQQNTTLGNGNWGTGFYADSNRNIVYNGCAAGGRTPFVGSYPLANTTVLGNGGDGFCSNGNSSCSLIECTSSFNSYQGFETYGGVVSGNVSGGETIIMGGCFRNNGHNAIYDSGSGQLILIRGRPTIFGNGSDPFPILIPQTPGTSSPTFSIPLAGMIPIASTPAVPASGTPYISPFPYPVLVTILGGTVASYTITPYKQDTYQGAQTITQATPISIILQPWDKIQISYTAAPTWTWQSTV